MPPPLQAWLDSEFCDSLIEDFARQVSTAHGATLSVVACGEIMYDNRLSVDHHRHHYLEKKKAGVIIYRPVYEFQGHHAHRDGKCLAQQLAKAFGVSPGALRPKRYRESWMDYVRACFADAAPDVVGLGRIMVLAKKGDTEHTTLVELVMNRCSRTRVIIIEPKLWRSRHLLCFKVHSRTTYELQPLGDICRCCQLPVHALRNLKRSSVKPHFQSPLTQCQQLGVLPSLESMMQKQSRLVRWIYPYAGGYYYADRLEEGDIYCQRVEDYRHGLRVTLQRHREHGVAFQRNYYYHALHQLRDAIHIPGTWSSLYGGLKKAEERILVALPAFARDTDDIKSQLIQVRQELGLPTRVAPRVYMQKGGESPPISISCHPWSIFNPVHFCMAEFAPIESAVATASAHDRRLQTFVQWMYTTFGLETLSSGVFSCSAAAQAAIQHRVSRSPLHLGLDKVHFGLTQLMQKHNRGQLFFSAAPYVRTGEPMSPFHNPLNHLAHLDISLAFTSCAAEFPMPSGFAHVYQLQPDGDVLEHQGYYKHRYGEFLLTYYHITRMARDPAVKIHTVLHAFTSQGQLVVDKSPLDLVIIYTKRTRRGGYSQTKQWMCFNFHHQWTHGCAICPPLERHIRGKTLEEITAESAAIDAKHTAFVRAAFGEERGQFLTQYFCHDGEYECPATGQMYPTIKALYRDTPDEFLQSLWQGPATSYTLEEVPEAISKYEAFLILEGEVGAEHRSVRHTFGYVMTQREGKVIAAHRTYGPTLMHSAMLQFLLTHRGFRLAKVHHMWLYRPSADYQSVFQELMQLRMSHGADSDMMKSFCNRAIGVWNSYNPIRSNLALYSYRIRHSWGKSKSSRYSVSTMDDECYQVKREYLKPTIEAPLFPLSLQVHLYAKLKVMNLLLFLEKYADPAAYRPLQFVGDGITLGLSVEHFRDLFSPDIPLLNVYSDTPTPGKFRMESETRGAFTASFPAVRTLRIEAAEFHPLTLNYTNGYMHHVCNLYCVPFGAE